MIILELLSCALPNAACTRSVIDVTIILFKTLKLFLQTYKPKDDNTHVFTNPIIKFFQTHIPDFGHLLNDFIKYLDQMPDELEEPNSKKSKKSEKDKKAGKGKENRQPMSKGVLQKLEAKNRRLPDLIFAFEEFVREFRNFGRTLQKWSEDKHDIKKVDIKKMQQLKIRDIARAR